VVGDEEELGRDDGIGDHDEDEDEERDGDGDGLGIAAGNNLGNSAGIVLERRRAGRTGVLPDALHAGFLTSA
jgi:hypothetical protein